MNRTFDKAKKLADDVNSHFGDVVVPLAISDYRLIPEGKYPVIQTTSCGLYPHNDDAPIYDKEFYELVEAGVDIIFNPAKTMFMKLCKESGARVYNGLKMLLYQGIAAFELWNDIKVPKITIMFIKAISQQLNDICPNPCYNNFQRYMCKENGRSKKCIQSLWQY